MHLIDSQSYSPESNQSYRLSTRSDTRLQTLVLMQRVCVDNLEGKNYIYYGTADSYMHLLLFETVTTCLVRI
jgi:hypothetical protein